MWLNISFRFTVFDRHGEKRVVKTLSRSTFMQFFVVREERCRVVMEACASAHHFGRRLRVLGYAVKLLPAQYVAQLVIGNKHDANDADAIFEASCRPKVRAVPVKTLAQQDVLAVHRVRERLMRSRTALMNQMRGLLSERGVVFGQRVGTFKRGLSAVLEQSDGEVTAPLRELLAELRAELQSLEQRIAAQDARLGRIYRHSVQCQQIGEVEGIGALTATAMVAAIGDARVFASGRQLSAWLGLTPKEHSSGQRRQLGGMSKRGDGYLRKLMVHGARAAVLVSKAKTDVRSRWIQALVQRRGHNKAVVALANKNTRIAWALLRTGECYRRPLLA